MYHVLNRASDILRKKKQNFAGFSGVNSQKNRPISRDFRGRKRQNSGKNRLISQGGSQNSQKNQPISRDFSEKSQISKDFEGQVLRKIGRFHGKFLGGTSPRNSQ